MIAEQVRARRWTQQEAAKRLGIGQPDLSRLMNGNVRGFSEARLERLLVSMDLVVRITVSTPGRNEKPGVLVEMA